MTYLQNVHCNTTHKTLLPDNTCLTIYVSFTKLIPNLGYIIFF